MKLPPNPWDTCPQCSPREVRAGRIGLWGAQDMQPHEIFLWSTIAMQKPDDLRHAGLGLRAGQILRPLLPDEIERVEHEMGRDVADQGAVQGRRTCDRIFGPIGRGVAATRSGQKVVISSTDIRQGGEQYFGRVVPTLPPGRHVDAHFMDNGVVFAADQGHLGAEFGGRLTSTPVPQRIVRLALISKTPGHFLLERQGKVV